MPLPRVAFELDDQHGALLYALEFEPESLRGSRSTFGTSLHLPATLVNFKAEPSYRPLLFAGMLCWEDEPGGLVIALQPLLFNRAELMFAVSDEQLVRLEERRAGLEPRFSLHMWGTAQDTATGTVRNVHGGYHSATLNVPRDRWIGILGACGFGKRRLIELPLPPTDLEGDWRAGSERIAAEASRIAAGESGVALAEVRNALERIVSALGANLGIERASSSGKNMALRSYVDKIAGDLAARHTDRTDDPFALLGGLLKSALSFSSAPGHTSFDTTARNDAILALNATITLYTYLAQFSPASNSKSADGGHSSYQSNAAPLSPPAITASSRSS